MAAGMNVVAIVLGIIGPSRVRALPVVTGINLVAIVLGNLLFSLVQFQIQSLKVWTEAYH